LYEKLFLSGKGEVENNGVSLTPVGFFSEYLRLCSTGKQSNLLLKKSWEYITVAESAVIFSQSMGARNREGIGLSYRPARQHSLAELVPSTSLESILGLLKSLKIRALCTCCNHVCVLMRTVCTIGQTKPACVTGARVVSGHPLAETAARATL
jgi:hypothetical protein